jgi:hypothetical protein
MTFLAFSTPAAIATHRESSVSGWHVISTSYLLALLKNLSLKFQLFPKASLLENFRNLIRNPILCLFQKPLPLRPSRGTEELINAGNSISCFSNLLFSTSHVTTSFNIQHTRRPEMRHPEFCFLSCSMNVGVAETPF